MVQLEIPAIFAVKMDGIGDFDMAAVALWISAVVGLTGTAEYAVYVVEV